MNANTSNKTRKFTILGTALTLALIFGVSTFGHVSTAYTQVGTNSIQDSLLTPVLSPVNPTYVLVNEQALNIFGKPLPSQVTISLAEAYNGGSPQNVGSCTVNTLGGSFAFCLFNAHFYGIGRYLFIGTVSSNGIVLAQTGIDPYIEPEW